MPDYGGKQFLMIKFRIDSSYMNKSSVLKYHVQPPRMFSPSQSPSAQLYQRTFAEFFAGIGLMRMALERQGWEIVYANDVDSQKYKMYKEQFPDTDSHFKLGDIHKISGNSIPSATLATASFPCNDLSLAGSREGLKGKQSSAFWGFIRVIEEMKSRRPTMILLENVTGFLTSHGGRDFHEAMLTLNKLGYSVDAFTLNALTFVPQSRQRLFVVGAIRQDSGDKEVLEQKNVQESEFRPKKLVEFITTHSDIRWNIRCLPDTISKKVDLREILDDLPETAQEWWHTERAEYLLNQMSIRHRKIADDMISGQVWSYGTVFRRIRNKKSMAELRTDGIAGCLRTPRGGSGRQILFKAGHGKYFTRLLTPRECSRLMGADGYHIEVPSNQALFGFGDAVCVPVVEWIAQHYLNPVVNEIACEHPVNPLDLSR